MTGLEKRGHSALLVLMVGHWARWTGSVQNGLQLPEPGRTDVAVSGPHYSSSLSGPTWANTQTLAQEPATQDRVRMTTPISWP